MPGTAKPAKRNKRHMALLNIAPTKSNLLSLRRQLVFAEEGYDLLEQKRQILVFELAGCLVRARDAEIRAAKVLGRAYAALREAALDMGGGALDLAAFGVSMDHQLELAERHLMGLRLPRAQARIEAPGAQFGLTGTTANADAAMFRFVETLPVLSELAGLQTAAARLSLELRKTQRRCNALSKILIPNYRRTITFITGSLEERERESFVILKMLRDRMAGIASVRPNF